MKNDDLRHARSRTMAQRKKRRKRMRGRRRIRERIFLGRVIGIGLVCLFACAFLSRGAMAGKEDEACITLKVEDVSIVQGEETPVFTAKAVCQEDAAFILDEDTGFTVQDLVDEMNQGTGYTLECDADGSREGSYRVKAKLTSQIVNSLNLEWFGKVRIDVKDGKFQVKNQYGEWDGDKFKRWDGNYVMNDFVVYHDNTYYFGEDGEFATGWQSIGGAVYFFGKKGIMKTGWHEEKDGTKYYFGENGTLSVGWIKVDGEEYYFDPEGKMLVGEQQVGEKKCVFAKDGRLMFAENSVDPEKPMVALTFDDGPGPRTDELLDALEKNNAHATFFMLGQRAVQYPDTVKKMAEIGCELGNHTYDHASLAKLDGGGVRKQVEDTNSAIADAAGQPATTLRPSYGAINDTVKKNVGMPMILWSIDTLDWKTRDAQATIDNVMSSVGDGDIILMHDIHTQTIDAAIALIPKLTAAGYQLVTVSEMAEARGYTLENGEKYAEFWPDN